MERRAGTTCHRAAVTTLHRAGLDCNFVFTSQSNSSLPAAVAANFGVMAVPRGRAIRNNLVIWEDSPLPKLYCALVVREGGDRTAVEELADYLSASRLQQIAHILQVPISFFFEGAPKLPGARIKNGEAPSPSYVSDFLATTDGLALTQAFMRIKKPTVRRYIVELVQQIAGAGN